MTFTIVPRNITLTAPVMNLGQLEALLFVIGQPDPIPGVVVPPVKTNWCSARRRNVMLRLNSELFVKQTWSRRVLSPAPQRERTHVQARCRRRQSWGSPWEEEMKWEREKKHCSRRFTWTALWKNLIAFSCSFWWEKQLPPAHLKMKFTIMIIFTVRSCYQAAAEDLLSRWRSWAKAESWTSSW